MKLKKKPHAAAALCSLLLAFAACNSAPPAGGGPAGAPGGGGGSGGAGAVAGGGAGAGAGVVSAADKPLDVMMRAVRAQLDAKSYRARMDMSTSAGTSTRMLVEYVNPDRYHVVTDTPAGGKSATLEYLVVGKDTYMKMGDGAWTKSPLDMGSMISSFRDEKVIEELARGAEIKFVGPDTLDGMPMLVYEYTLDNVGGVAVKSVTRTWVAVSDGLPRKSESDAEFQGTKTKTVSRISDYNADIKIEPPAK